MPRVLHRAGVCLLSAALAWAQTPAQLNIQIQEGKGVTVPRGSVSPRRFTVEVTDARGKAVAGASVTFRLSQEGPSGTFPSGLRQESFLTAADGKASVYGIHWNDTPGSTRLLVRASLNGTTQEAEIPLEISSSAKGSAADSAVAAKVKGPRSSGTKWLVIAGVAGGALAGAAFALGGSGSGKPLPTLPPVVVQPSIGAPTITVGRP